MVRVVRRKGTETVTLRQPAPRRGGGQWSQTVPGRARKKARVLKTGAAVMQAHSHRRVRRPLYTPRPSTLPSTRLDLPDPHHHAFHISRPTPLMEVGLSCPHTGEGGVAPVSALVEVSPWSRTGRAHAHAFALGLTRSGALHRHACGCGREARFAMPSAARRKQAAVAYAGYETPTPPRTTTQREPGPTPRASRLPCALNPKGRARTCRGRIQWHWPAPTPPSPLTSTGRARFSAPAIAGCPSNSSHPSLGSPPS